METQKVIVTGAGGFIGSNIVLELERQGHEIITLDNFSTGVKQNLREFKGNIINADIRNFNWQKEKVNAIIHEAAITDTTVKNRKLMLAINFEAFKRIVEHAEKNGINLVYASSAAVYGKGKVPMREHQKPDILSYYAESKLKMDKFAKTKFEKFENKKLSLVGLRYFNVYGHREAHKKKMASMIFKLYLQIKGGMHPRIFKNGKQTRDQVYVKDVVNATILALKAGKNGIYNVGSGKETSFNKVIALLNKNLETNLDPEYIDNPYIHFQERTLADLTYAKKFLQYTPKWQIEKGIKDYIRLLELQNF